MKKNPTVLFYPAVSLAVFAVYLFLARPVFDNWRDQNAEVRRLINSSNDAAFHAKRLEDLRKAEREMTNHDPGRMEAPELLTEIPNLASRSGIRNARVENTGGGKPDGDTARLRIRFKSAFRPAILFLDALENGPLQARIANLDMMSGQQGLDVILTADLTGLAKPARKP